MLLKSIFRQKGLANNRVTIPGLASIQADSHKSRVTVAQSAVVNRRMIEEQRDFEILTDIQHNTGAKPI